MSSGPDFEFGHLLGVSGDTEEVQPSSGLEEVGGMCGGVGGGLVWNGDIMPRTTPSAEKPSGIPRRALLPNDKPTSQLRCGSQDCNLVTHWLGQVALSREGPGAWEPSRAGQVS